MDNPPANPPVSGITTEQLHQAIEKARLEEREKLRKSLEESQARSAKDQADAAKITELLAEVDRLKALVEAYEKAKTAGGEIDVPKLVAEVTENVRRELTTKDSKKESEIAETLKTMQSRLLAFELKELEAKLVAEVGGYGKVVKAVIRGNNAEELAASVRIAHEAYLEIEKQINPSGTVAPANGADPSLQNGQGNNRTITPPPVLVPAGQGGTGGSALSSTLTGVRELSASDYKANREKIKQDMARRYPASARR